MRFLLSLFLASLSSPVLAESLPEAASLLMQQEIVQQEADYVFNAIGDRKAACRLWRKSYRLGGEAAQAFPSEKTGTAQISPAVSIRKHCLDMYPDFRGYPTPIK
jgi:hypothetical protein